MRGVVLVACGWVLAGWMGVACGQTEPPADAGAPPPLRVMTFNIRYGTADDGPNAWPHRRDMVIETIQALDPDLLGTQETLGFQAQFLAEQLPHLEYVGRSRDEDPEHGEQCSVFFRRERFEKLAEGHFWLSPTPDRPASRGWDAALPRMATWVRLWDRKALRPVVFINTHLDHVGRQARSESAGKLHDFIEHLYPPAAVILTGDFNSPAESPVYQRLVTPPQLRDAYRLAHPEVEPGEGTFNRWKGETSGARIDWIVVGPSWSVRDARILHDNRDGRYPSDHYPVAATLQYLNVATPAAAAATAP